MVLLGLLLVLFGIQKYTKICTSNIRMKKQKIDSNNIFLWTQIYIKRVILRQSKEVILINERTGLCSI